MAHSYYYSLSFFAVSSPTDIARRVKGPKAKEDVLQRWIAEKGYDKPVFYNSEATSLTAKVQDTIFFSYISKLCTFSFGKSDYDDQPIWWKLKDGVGPSLFNYPHHFRQSAHLHIHFYAGCYV